MSNSLLGSEEEKEKNTLDEENICANQAWSFNYSCYEKNG